MTSERTLLLKLMVTSASFLKAWIGLPHADEHVELRIYETHSRKVIIERSDDLLTPEEVEQNKTAVVQAILDELKTWEGYKCFCRRPRKSAPCVIDVRWVFKFKIVKGERKIRARLCLRRI